MGIGAVVGAGIVKLLNGQEVSREQVYIKLPRKLNKRLKLASKLLKGFPSIKDGKLGPLLERLAQINHRERDKASTVLSEINSVLPGELEKLTIEGVAADRYWNFDMTIRSIPAAVRAAFGL